MKNDWIVPLNYGRWKVLQRITIGTIGLVSKFWASKLS